MVRRLGFLWLFAVCLLASLPTASTETWEVLNDDSADDEILGMDSEPSIPQEADGSTSTSTRSLFTQPESQGHNEDDVIGPKFKDGDDRRGLQENGGKPKLEVYGDQSQVDCEDDRFMGTVDCPLGLTDTNLSNAGLKARQQLMDFMELKRQKRQSDSGSNGATLLDEGSGTGDIYPDSTDISNGIYNVELGISFNVSQVTNTTEEELRGQLVRAFLNVTGFAGVNVTQMGIVNGTLVATYEVSFTGTGISAYGSDLQSIADGLAETLKNVTKPYYETIEIGGKTPMEPFNPSTVASIVAERLLNICDSSTPCPQSFELCQATGIDEGRCIHRCAIFQQDRECEHGGTCELDADLNPFCSCSDNWSGTFCQDAIRSDDMDKGMIAGVVLGALLITLGIIGCCCWFCVCRRKRNPSMTEFSDDRRNDDAFSSPSSKISTFVIDRPRLSSAPFSAFNPGPDSTWMSRSKYSRARSGLFSDA